MIRGVGYGAVDAQTRDIHRAGFMQ